MNEIVQELNAETDPLAIPAYLKRPTDAEEASKEVSSNQEVQ